MPHERKRHLTEVIKHLAKMSPLTGLLGHRQVGKTTLLEAVSQYYLSFDDDDVLGKAQQNPKKFLSSLQELETAIDECQLCEKIFPALKERVRKNKRPGQFYLSGSVRFTSKKVIRESLTGRIMNVDLLPFTVSELDHGELPDTIVQLLKVHRMQDLPLQKLTAKEYGRRMNSIGRYETCGGLPGVCFIRNAKLRAQKIMFQVETILNRDLRQVYETTLTLPDILRYVRQLALHDGSDIQYQELYRMTGLTPLTQKKLLFALEAIFIIRHLPIEGDKNGSAIFFEDHAEVATLAQQPLSDEKRWAGLIYRNIREQVFYRLGLNADFFQYRTRAGVLVPFAIKAPEGALGFICVRGSPSRAAMAAAQSFLRTYAHGKAVVVTDANEARVVDDRTIIISAAHLLFS